VGVALIIVGSIGSDDPPAASLPPIARPSETPAPTVAPTATPTDPGSDSPSASGDPSAEPSAEPTPTPLPDDVVAEQLEVPSVGINIVVRQSTSAETDSFPP